MEKYLGQLIGDIRNSVSEVNAHKSDLTHDIWDWISDEEEEKTAPVRELEEVCGIRQIELPPHHLLSDDQVDRLLPELLVLLEAYNWSFTLQTLVPNRIQYRCIQENFAQPIKMKSWNHGFFAFCKEGTKHKTCSLGEHCQCEFYAQLFARFEPDTRTPEEQRAAHLEIEVNHIKRKYGDDWMKYYPYHLDAEYDDEDGNPYDYGFGDYEDDEDDDNWWRT